MRKEKSEKRSILARDRGRSDGNSALRSLPHAYYTTHSSGLLEEAKMAVLHNLGSSIPMVPFQHFLQYLAPPQPDFDLNATIQSLKSGSNPVLTSSNRWSKFPEVPGDPQCLDDEVFGSMSYIFTKIVVAVAANSGGRLREEARKVDFLQNPSPVPESAHRRNGSRPDGYLVLKDRNKGMSEDWKREDTPWADIVLSCEYKRKDGRHELCDVCICHIGGFDIAC